MKIWIVISEILTTIFSFAAAYYWYKSSKVEYPKALVGSSMYGGLSVINTNPILLSINESGRLNKIAAGLSTVAAFFGGLTALLQSV